MYARLLKEAGIKTTGEHVVAARAPTCFLLANIGSVVLCVQP